MKGTFYCIVITEGGAARMMSKQGDTGRDQVEIISLDELVPSEHLVRKIEAAIDWSFIYELVEGSYCEDNGRPSLDPVILIKLPVLQYMFGIRSMRQTIREIEVNNAYRWFLGLGLHEKAPHFSTFGKNYVRRFEGTDLFEKIFQQILSECVKAGLVDESVVFVDSTHVKARANSKKYVDEIAEEQALWYEQQLIEEIQKDRKAHGKEPLKEEAAENGTDDNDDETPKGGGGKPNPNTSKKKQKRRKEEKHIKKSTSDPESGWFRKGEHKNVFAYSVQTACDRHGVVLGYSVNPGNEHDSRTFKDLYEKIKNFNTEIVVADSAYKTPAIAKLLHDDGKELLSTYSRPKTKDKFFRKYEYVYDAYYDCYICPNDQILKYSTSNREGYREYKSDAHICSNCPYREKCTESRNCTKVVTRHVWEDDLERVEEQRHTYGIREYYELRKETIERVFATAKELHGFRYTQEYGKAHMEIKAALTFACINLKKLARKRWKGDPLPSLLQTLFDFLHFFFNFYATNPLSA